MDTALSLMPNVTSWRKLDSNTCCNIGIIIAGCIWIIESNYMSANVLFMWPSKSFTSNPSFAICWLSIKYNEADNEWRELQNMVW